MNTHYTLYTKYKIQTTPICIWDHLYVNLHLRYPWSHQYLNTTLTHPTLQA